MNNYKEPEKRKYMITITAKNDGRVVRVLKAIHYFIDTGEDITEGIANISVFYEDADGNYGTAFYPLVLFDFEILEI